MGPWTENLGLGVDEEHPGDLFETRTEDFHDDLLGVYGDTELPECVKPIFVQLPDGGARPLDGLEAFDDVVTFKGLIRDLYGILADRQCLRFTGTQLEDHHTFS